MRMLRRLADIATLTRVQPDALLSSIGRLRESFVTGGAVGWPDPDPRPSSLAGRCSGACSVEPKALLG
jgi:hypothetical protein